MTKFHNWSKAYLAVPRDNILSHERLKNPKFIPSYENDSTPPTMNLILGGEYARIWEKEHDEYVKQRQVTEKRKFITNNYTKWLEKRSCKPKKPIDSTNKAKSKK